MGAVTYMVAFLGGTEESLSIRASGPPEWSKGQGCISTAWSAPRPAPHAALRQNLVVIHFYGLQQSPGSEVPLPPLY